MTLMGVREHRAADVARLRHQGLGFREIASQLGISRSYASALYHDPSGHDDRVRKDQYRGTCIDCGGPTDGSNGPNSAPERCNTCTNARIHFDREFTPTYIINLIRLFHANHGHPPILANVCPAHDAVQQRRGCRRQLVDDWETYRGNSLGTSAYREFGSWKNALEAAGFDISTRRGGLAKVKATPAMPTIRKLMAERLVKLDQMIEQHEADIARYRTERDEINLMLRASQNGDAPA